MSDSEKLFKALVLSCSHASHGGRLKHGDIGLAKALNLAMVLSKKVASSSIELFSVGEVSGGGFFVATNEFGRDICRWLNWDAYPYKLLFSFYNLNPYIGGFIDVVKKYDFFGVGIGFFKFRCVDYFRGAYESEVYSKECVILLVGMLNACVSELRRGLNKEDFKRGVNNHCRSANKNNKELCCFIDRLRMRSSSMVAFWVDFEVRQDARVDGWVEMGEIRKMFLRKLRYSKELGGLLGCIWKAEWKLSKGHCLRMVFFAGEGGADIGSYYARRLGGIWVGVVKKAREGWSSDVSLESFPFVSLGELNCADKVGEAKLKENLMCVAKVDIYWKLRLPNKAKGFGKCEF